MKKASLILAFSMFVVSLFSIPAFAADNNKSTTASEQVIEQKEEIKDIDVLFERAQKNISDDVDEKILKRISPIVSIKNMDTNKMVTNKDEDIGDVKLFKTTQKLKVTKNKNGDTSTNYATTVFATVSYTRTDSDSNAGYDLKATSTIYYSTLTVGNCECVTLTRATGYWQNTGSGITRTDGTVTGHVNGNSSQTGLITEQSQLKSDYNTDPFDFSFSGFVPVVNNVPFTLVGATMRCSWRHGTSGSWYQFSFANNYQT